MGIEKTMSHVEREVYENEIGQLRREIERLGKCCSQRGARMQIMRQYMAKPRGLGPSTEWDYFAEDMDGEPYKWFDADGVHIVNTALRGEGEK